MAPRRTLCCSLLFICLFALNACEAPAGAPADPGPPSGPPSVSASGSTDGSAQAPSSDPRPTPASSRGPARNVPPPVLPEVAKQNTAEGFEAFTQYWFDTITFGLETRDPIPLTDNSLSDCKMCASYLESIVEARSSDGWSEGPRWSVAGFRSDMSVDPAGRRVGYFYLDESPSADYKASSGRVSESPGGRVSGVQSLYATYQGGRWRVAEAGGA